MKNNRSLFIIKSPFQVLCALGKIRSLSPEDYDVILLKDEKNGKMAEKILVLNNCNYTIVEDVTGYKDIINRCKPYKNNYKRTYVGNYYAISQYLMAIICTCRGGIITYLDDGNATLDMFPPTNMPRYYHRNCKRAKDLKRKILLLNSVRRFKRVGESLLTIYNIKSTRWYIENNEAFDQVISSTSHREGCYIIGTRSSYIMSKAEYEKILSQTIKHIKEYYPEDIIYYCPHRADDYNYCEFLDNNDVQLFNTECSVEVDFSLKRINPNMIVGYGSTALIPLHKMFPSAKVVSYSFEIADSMYESSMNVINEYYSREGISIESLF